MKSNLNISFRRLIRAPQAAFRLINMVVNILDGTENCPNLVHFVWLTSMSHPILRDEPTSYVIARGYRWKSTISAANQFYLSYLLKAKIKNGLKLTIIDTFSIIQPRFIFEESLETCAGGYHYTCRHTNPDSSGQYLMHTPAGDAIMDAILHAFSHPN